MQGLPEKLTVRELLEAVQCKHFGDFAETVNFRFVREDEPLQEAVLVSFLLTVFFFKRIFLLLNEVDSCDGLWNKNRRVVLRVISLEKSSDENTSFSKQVKQPEFLALQGTE